MAVRAPWYIETRIASARPASDASGQLQPLLYIRVAISTPTNPITEPTDKSMCRATITSTTTVDTMPTTAVCCAMLYRFSGDRKMPSDRTLNTTATATSTELMSTRRQSMAACLRLVKA